MSKNSLPAHIEGLLRYLGQPHEKANEDLALSYFRKIFPNFTRQSDASRSDGYVKGHFVLELKGKTKDWYSGLFQGLAYKRDLDFSVIVVATKGFLGVWKINDLPDDIIEACLTSSGASSTIGKKIASDYKHLEKQVFEKAIWSDDQMFLLFNENHQYFVDKIASFENTLRSCEKVRLKITPTNFTKILKELAQFFDYTQPIKAVAAFYTMIYSWDENSIVSLSKRDQTQASLSGEAIRYLVPGRRVEFKKFVENYYIDQSDIENMDEFFAQYDKAIDSVDKNFRVQHGIYFTDLNLSKFVMWLVKQSIPDLGKNYIVIDPACGSGNLVTNWRSPLELRHKIVSELEPDLLYAVDQRLKKDPWHAGRFTVVPKVGTGEGLNFLDKSAKDYIDIVEQALKEIGKKFDKPIAFLCNPPYRGDDDTSAESINYSIHQSIINCIGKEAQAERYCCFLAQMKLICDQVVESGLPGDTRLLLFTKSAWLTNRKSFSKLKQEIFNSFGYMGGALFDGKEFFDLKGKFPIAFTIWSYKNQKITYPEITIELRDLTWLKKKQLCEVDWKESEIVDTFCKKIISDKKTILIPFGMERKSIKDWSHLTRKDLIRNRRKNEVSNIFCGGLPKDDARLNNNSAYGYRDGNTIGFMEDLTPCRTFAEMKNVPWFTLDERFLRVRRNRCFSGQPDSRGYCASNYLDAKKLFLWYALTKTFVDNPPPMWTDAMQIWTPTLKEKQEKIATWYSFAIGFAENDCIETSFPANNPVEGLNEIYCSNPMSPNYPDSFWSKIMSTDFLEESDKDFLPKKLVNAVLKLYKEWKSRFHYSSEIKVAYKRKYFIGEGTLTPNAGIVQILDYARERDDVILLNLLKDMRALLKDTKKLFFELLINPHQINYFGSSLKNYVIDIVNEPKRIFPVNEVRLTLGTMIVKSLCNSKGFGKTKFAKVFYIADMMSKKNLKTKYYREVAGPVDYNILYNKKVSIEKLAFDKGYFTTAQEGKRVKYIPGKNIDNIENIKKEIFGNELIELEKIINKFKDLNTDQAEVVATLFACWNDLLIDKKEITDEIIIEEFHNNWHFSKKRFPKQKLLKILQRMKEHNIIPQGIKGHTYFKPDKN